MTITNYKKWKLVSGILFIFFVTGISLAIAVPKLETIGVLLILSSYVGGIISSSKVGFDNKRLWVALTFCFPYIILPILYLRDYDKTVLKYERKKDKEWNVALKKVHLAIEEYIRLFEKSTMSSLLKSGNLFNSVVQDQQNWQPLCAIVSDKNVHQDVRIVGIKMLKKIENNEFVDEVLLKLSRDDNQTIRNAAIM